METNSLPGDSFGWAKQSGFFHQSKIKWQKEKEKKEKILKKFESAILKQSEKYDKLNDIEECKKIIILLKQTIKTVKKDIEKAEYVCLKTKERLLQRKTKSERHSEKVTKIYQYITCRGQIIEQGRVETETALVRLQKERQLHLNVLVNYIFPISETHPSQADSLLISTVSAIKDACQTAYVRGQWQYTDIRSDTMYRILEPTLPTNGNYSAYSLWVSMKGENCITPEQDCGRSNLGHTFTAALCYATQLLSIFFCILDINTPRRLCFSEFCSDELSEKQLNTCVTKLNHNIFYLCFAQGIEWERLSPKDTLHNLYILFNNANIGRCVPFEVSEEMMQSVTDGSISDDSDDEPYTVTDDIGLDWELPDDVPDLTNRVSYTSSNYPTPYSTQASTMNEPGGLLASATTSIVSFWQAARSTFERR